jgi:hypothetical protein
MKVQGNIDVNNKCEPAIVLARQLIEVENQARVEVLLKWLTMYEKGTSRKDGKVRIVVKIFNQDTLELAWKSALQVRGSTEKQMVRKKSKKAGKGRNYQISDYYGMGNNFAISDFYQSAGYTLRKLGGTS